MRRTWLGFAALLPIRRKRYENTRYTSQTSSRRIILLLNAAARLTPRELERFRLEPVCSILFLVQEVFDIVRTPLPFIGCRADVGSRGSSRPSGDAERVQLSYVGGRYSPFVDNNGLSHGEYRVCTDMPALLRVCDFHRVNMLVMQVIHAEPEGTRHERLCSSILLFIFDAVWASWWHAQRNGNLTRTGRRTECFRRHLYVLQLYRLCWIHAETKTLDVISPPKNTSAASSMLYSRSTRARSVCQARQPGGCT